MLRTLIPIVLIVVVVAGTAVGQDEWQFRPGILLTSGDQSHTFKDGSGEILSVNGWRRVSRARLDDISIYHVIILRPSRPLISQGSAFSNKDPTSTDKLSWTIQLNPPNDFKTGEEHSFDTSYDSLNNLVAMAGKTFDLSSGNLFVVRFTENWTATAVQIPARLYKRAKPQAVLNFFKSHLRRDKTIQRLTLA